MRFDLPAEKTLTYEMVIPIRWGDMDAMGHVNNTVYLRYFESIRIDWLKSLLGPPDSAGEGPVIVNVFCNFLRQLKYPGDVLARHYASDAGRTSLLTWVTLERTDEPGVHYATGGAKMVWLNYRQEKSVLLPEAIRRLVEPSERASAAAP